MKNQSGNALIYVLIVVGLFAMLNFVISRNADTSETGVVSNEKVGINAGQILQVSAQVKQAIDMMSYSGWRLAPGNSLIDELDFTTPDDEPAYSTLPHTKKVFHPDGGGVIMPRIPADAITQVNADPVAKWYIGRFNTVEWTDDADTKEDVILVAHQISQATCADLNEKITGSSVIPALTGVKTIPNLMIFDGIHTGTNEDFDIVDCPACEGWPTLCVSNPAATIYSFYNIVAQQ